MDSQSFVMLLWLLGALFAGFFVHVTRARALVQVNRAINALVYGLLLLIGFSLAKQDALGAQLAEIGGRAALLFACVIGVNLPVMMAFDYWRPWRRPIRAAQGAGSKIRMTGTLLQMASILAGLALGAITPQAWRAPDGLITCVLVVLIALVGVQLRASGVRLRQVFLHRRSLELTAVFSVSALLGGLLFALISGTHWALGMALASGFGWYSLSSVVLSTTHGPLWSGVAFLNDMGREFFALFVIPFLMRRTPSAAVGTGGATTMDFTLPVIQHSGGAEATLLAISFGFLVSILSPMLLVFFASWK